jgi:hypothetical protein
MTTAHQPAGVTRRRIDTRVPAPPADLIEILDSVQQAVADAYWRIGYAAALNALRSWRDQIPAGVRILDDHELHSRREG